jgi:hypothetical protein
MSRLRKVRGWLKRNPFGDWSRRRSSGRSDHSRRVFVRASHWRANRPIPLCRINCAAAGTIAAPRHGRRHPTRPLGSWDSRTGAITRGLYAAVRHPPSRVVQRDVGSGTRVAVEHDDTPREHAWTPLDGGRKTSDLSTAPPNLGWLTSIGTNDVDGPLQPIPPCIRNAGISACYAVPKLLHNALLTAVVFCEQPRADLWPAVFPGSYANGFHLKDTSYMSLVFRKIISIPGYVDVRFGDVTIVKTAMLYLWAVTPCKLPKRTTPSLVALVTRNRQSNQASSPPCTFSGV